MELLVLECQCPGRDGPDVRPYHIHEDCYRTVTAEEVREAAYQMWIANLIANLFEEALAAEEPA